MSIYHFNLTTFMCPLSIKILGASTSWSPKGLSRLVMGYLYLYHLNHKFKKPIYRLTLAA